MSHFIETRGPRLTSPWGNFSSALRGYAYPLVNHELEGLADHGATDHVVFAGT